MTSLPATVKPMLATLMTEPFDSASHIFEVKWDGVRALAFIEGGQLRLQGRNLRFITHQYPELRCLLDQVQGDGVVLDGEIVSLDGLGHPDLSRLQERMKLEDPAAIALAAKRQPVHYQVFDLLYLDGQSVMEEPLWRRKNLLHHLLTPSERVQATDFVEREGVALFQAVLHHRLEGVVAKAKDSLYLPGKRISAWSKLKAMRQGKFVIGGYAFGGRRKEPFSSLLLGTYQEGRLRYVGSVVGGFSEAALKEIYPRLQALVIPTCPFLEPPAIPHLVYWCQPALVCQVRFGEWTRDRRLRFPIFVTLRPDLDPSDCTGEGSVEDVIGAGGLARNEIEHG